MLHTNAVVSEQFAIRLQDRVGSGQCFWFGAVYGGLILWRSVSYPCEIRSRLENKHYGLYLISSNFPTVPLYHWRL